ncbi:hypothetical protein [Kordia jejudonensis]|uniref:hypothetical protein n=1 Tax=Kordia jejudonensis TaxID=1348245 RepID=UPI0006291263|nr:hypothetical protein [Kordia jejudonensis]
MNTAQQKAIYYFQSYTDYFWQWEIDYMFDAAIIENAQDYQGGINCIAVPDGITIAYKEQLEKILEAISTNGFPPFGALVLAFLATNSGEVSQAIDDIFKNIQETFDDDLLFKHINFAEAQHFLDTLIELPAAYKKDKNKIDLFVFLFKECPYMLQNKYEVEILRCIKNKAFELNACSQKAEITMTALSKDFNVLAALDQRYPTVNALLKAWGKVVPVEVAPEDTEIATLSEEISLIQQLIEDPKTFFMGNLIKRIWSGIQLPMHYAHPGEMPLGGISDITNKGKFDNLLISEYANDDIIFLHRIANKEALFIRRETTPEEDLRTRIFLIDTTIKNWGTPKIVSFATAFALIHHPKNEMDFQSYAIGETHMKLTFDEKIKIIEGLQITAPLLDASSAIEQFIVQCEEENIEITLFTSPKTLQHATMQRVLNLHHEKFGGIITADTKGNLDVYKLKNGSKRLVKHILLPLEELWTHSPNALQKKLKNKKSEKPSRAYPLLYGYPNGYLTHFFTADAGYVLQKRGILYKMNAQYKGFEIVRNDLQFMSNQKKPIIATLFNDEIIIVSSNTADWLHLKTEHESYTCKGDYSVQYKSHIKNLLVHEEELYLITKKQYSATPVFLKINLEYELTDEITTPSKALINQYNTCSDNYFGYFSGSVFTKIRSVSITRNLTFIFNDLHKIKFADDSLAYELDKSEQSYAASAVFINKTTFTFLNKSSIEIDKKGVLTFSSPNPSIQTFYLSSYIDVTLAMATDTEFAGNEYFLPEDSKLNVISVKDFKRKYIDPFIVNIVTP